VGPAGIRAFLRASLSNAYASLHGLRLQIHEIDEFRCYRRGRHMRPPVHVSWPHRVEVPGLTLLPEEDGSWLVPASPMDLPIAVRAVELDHTVPTVGWVLTEEPRPGKLSPGKVVPLLKKHQMPLMLLQKLKAGIPIELPDGQVIRPEDHVGPATQRKLALLSDTRDVPRTATAHSKGATLVVHECTNACTSDDLANGSSYADVERYARSHGHSTPQIAGRFARDVGAGHLVLTHFSSRYPGDGSHFSRRIMSEIRGLARQQFRGGVTCASDLMLLNISADGTIDVCDERDAMHRGAKGGTAVERS